MDGVCFFQADCYDSNSQKFDQLTLDWKLVCAEPRTICSNEVRNQSKNQKTKAIWYAMLQTNFFQITCWKKRLKRYYRVQWLTELKKCFSDRTRAVTKQPGYSDEVLRRLSRCSSN